MNANEPVVTEEDVINSTVRVQLETFIDRHRLMLRESLDGLTEEQARRSLVPSRTTLLGLVKHAIFVEQVWFDVAITGRSRAAAGIVATPDESFVLSDDDTIESVCQRHRAVCAESKRTAAGLALNTVVYGNRRGPLPLHWIYLHVLRELAQHGGHADILREQILRS